MRAHLVTNLPVVTEVVYMLDFSPQAQRDFLSDFTIYRTRDRRAFTNRFPQS